MAKLSTHMRVRMQDKKLLRSFFKGLFVRDPEMFSVLLDSRDEKKLRDNIKNLKLLKKIKK